MNIVTFFSKNIQCFDTLRRMRNPLLQVVFTVSFGFQLIKGTLFAPKELKYTIPKWKATSYS
jgi:hypothetical protein